MSVWRTCLLYQRPVDFQSSFSVGNPKYRNPRAQRVLQLRRAGAFAWASFEVHFWHTSDIHIQVCTHHLPSAARNCCLVLSYICPSLGCSASVEQWEKGNMGACSVTDTSCSRVYQLLQSLRRCPRSQRSIMREDIRLLAPRLGTPSLPPVPWGIFQYRTFFRWYSSSHCSRSCGDLHLSVFAAHRRQRRRFYIHSICPPRRSPVPG